MASTEIQRLLDGVAAAHRACETAAAALSNQELERPVALSRGRQEDIRRIVYRMVTHAREHTVHMKKLLAETGAPGARPTEAQLILEQAGEALGGFKALFARMTDLDLDREYEGHTPRMVLEHVKSGYDFYLPYIQGKAGQ